ncbi:MAG: hypothetical protein LBH03_01905 [Holophagales bacterium]|nr:hypothetical protein [Holophagales bacterium]
MATVSFREDELPPISEERKAELRALANKPANFSDIPEVTDFSDWMTAEEAKAYRATKKKQMTTI